jgi:hypothetical protein
MRPAVSTLLAMLVFGWAVGQAEEPEVAITVYNSDMALVKDVRTIELEEDVSRVRFSDVAQRIDPTSVHFKVVRGPDAQVWEQNYQFDLASSSKILEKYLEKTIDVITEDADLFTGKLISFDGATVVLDQGKGAGPIVTLNREKVSYVRFPALPSGLISKPTLVWTVAADEPGERLVEVTYITSGINWHAEYVGVTDAADETIDLAAWVSIDNRSGATYADAKLDLVAGDVHRALEPRQVVGMREKADAAEMVRAPEFREEALFEYHLYKLDTRATVADREIKQLTFFPGTTVQVEKVLEFDYWHGRDTRVLLEFENSEDAGLGRPLPAGKVRMYKEDSTGALQFIGEDRVDHTPKDEDVKLYLGNAFDVAAERKVIDRRKITDKVREEDYEVSIRNHKDEDIVVRVVEHPQSYWSVVTSSHAYEKMEANRIEFSIPVATSEETVLTYTIRYEY